MLGSMTADFLSRDPSFEVSSTVRDPAHARLMARRIPEVAWRVFRADGKGLRDLFLSAGSPDWVINAIGVIKPHIREDDPHSVENAIHINALFPHRLAAAAKESGFRVIQIATDCTYSGRDGNRVEDSPHDPTDVYGKTKSLGEVRSEGMHHVRCSIIGPEPKGHLSLLEWFRGRPEGAEVTGFVNHRWNGVTTFQFARICGGIIREDIALPHCQHLVPGDSVTKADVLAFFAAVFGREDIRILRGDAASVVDRTLATLRPDLSDALWKAAGYGRAPSVQEMIGELGEYPFRPGEI